MFRAQGLCRIRLSKLYKSSHPIAKPRKASASGVIQRICGSILIGIILAVFSPQQIKPFGEHRYSVRRQNKRISNFVARYVRKRRHIMRSCNPVKKAHIVVAFEVIYRLRRKTGGSAHAPAHKIFKAVEISPALCVGEHKFPKSVVPRRKSSFAQSRRNMPPETPRLGNQNHVGIFLF